MSYNAGPFLTHKVFCNPLPHKMHTDEALVEMVTFIPVRRRQTLYSKNIRMWEIKTFQMEKMSDDCWSSLYSVNNEYGSFWQTQTKVTGK